jgi:hypothetical protein
MYKTLIFIKIASGKREFAEKLSKELNSFGLTTSDQFKEFGHGKNKENQKMWNKNPTPELINANLAKICKWTIGKVVLKNSGKCKAYYESMKEDTEKKPMTTEKKPVTTEKKPMKEGTEKKPMKEGTEENKSKKTEETTTKKTEETTTKKTEETKETTTMKPEETENNESDSVEDSKGEGFCGSLSPGKEKRKALKKELKKLKKYYSN